MNNIGNMGLFLVVLILHASVKWELLLEPRCSSTNYSVPARCKTGFRTASNTEFSDLNDCLVH